MERGGQSCRQAQMPQTRRGARLPSWTKPGMVTEPSPRRPGAERSSEAARVESSQQLEWKPSLLSAGRKRDPDVPRLAPRLAYRGSTFLAQLSGLRSQEQLLRAEGEAPAIWAACRVCVRVAGGRGRKGALLSQHRSWHSGSPLPSTHAHLPPRGSGSAAGWHTSVNRLW